MPLMDCFGNHEYCPQQVIVVLFIAMFTDLPDIDPSMKCRKASCCICRHFPVQMHVNKLHYHHDRKQFIRSGRRRLYFRVLSSNVPLLFSVTLKRYNYNKTKCICLPGDSTWSRINECIVARRSCMHVRALIVGRNRASERKCQRDVNLIQAHLIVHALTFAVVALTRVVLLV